MKKMYARQRAKDLAEHAKSLLSKEKELDELRKQILSQRNDQVFPVWVMILTFHKWKSCSDTKYSVAVLLYYCTTRWSIFTTCTINPEYSKNY